MPRNYVRKNTNPPPTVNELANRPPPPRAQMVGTEIDAKEGLFQRRHYEAIASVISDVNGKLWYDPAYADAIAIVQTRLADLFASDNPRFDRARFLKASSC